MGKLFFCGISGSGVSALAQVMKLKGYDVCGSDRAFDLGSDLKNKKALEEVGIKIFPQDGTGVTDDIETIYISTAVEDDNKDIKAALAKNIPIKKRFQLLAELFHQYTYNIAVGGTSGKTTTTAMIGYILDVLGQKPMMINGGLLKNYSEQKGIPNIIYNNGDICAIEVDESNGSINEYYPYISLLNNIALDHKPLPELMELFESFINRAKLAAVINIDDDNIRKIIPENKKTVTFSIKDKDADFYAYNIKPLSDGTQYTLDGRDFKLNLIGEFNVSNALGAIAVCSLLGIDKFDAAKALEGFTGTVRRLEVMGKNKDITFISDFAHNPHKVAGSLSALKSYSGRLMIVFQPHGFLAMKLTGMEIMETFASFLDKEDVLIIPDIFYQGGTVDESIHSKDLVKKAEGLCVNVLYLPSREQVHKFILENAKAGDRVVIMGARDGSLPDFAKSLAEEI